MRKRLAFLMVLASSLFICETGAADPPTDGPRSLLITYRCEPANRPAFRSYLAHDERANLEKLHSQGVLESYQILFNPFVSSGTWDAMLVLTFTHYTDTQRWKEIERTAPGGLTPKGLRLAKPLDTYSADTEWSGSSPDANDSADGVYYVIPYEYSSASQYRKYVDAYVIPQVSGWMQEGALAGYRIFMNRFPVGRPWDALFIYQYRDLAAFGRRDELVAKVRETLVNDPQWRQLNEIKQTLRTESENTITESLAESSAPGTRTPSPRPRG